MSYAESPFDPVNETNHCASVPVKPFARATSYADCPAGPSNPGCPSGPINNASTPLTTSPALFDDVPKKNEPLIFATDSCAYATPIRVTERKISRKASFFMR